MGLADRDYARTPPPPHRGRAFFTLSITFWLIIINVGVFVLDSILSTHGIPQFTHTEVVLNATPGPTTTESFFRDAVGKPVPPNLSLPVGAVVYKHLLRPSDAAHVGRRVYVVRPPLQAFGQFSTHQAFQRLEVWRFVTFQFLHANSTHLIMNMFGLFMFGRAVEDHLGRRKYAAYYLVTGIFGALLYLLLNLIGVILQAIAPNLHVPGVLFYETTVPLIGASAGVFGVIVACAFIAPDERVHLLIPPISLRLRTFAYGYVVIELLYLFLGSSNQGGHAAHLGGAISGYYFIRRSYLLRDFFDILGDSRRPPPSARIAHRAPSSDPEIDRILRKIHQHGQDSLTPDELATLRRAADPASARRRD